MNTLVKSALVAGTISLGLMAGQATAGTPVTFVSDGIYAPGTINLSGYGNEYSSALNISALYGAAQTPKTLYAFCVDLSHQILVNSPGTTDIVTANGNNQYAQTLHYQTAALTTDSSGTLSGTGVALSGAQIGEIGDLAHEGGSLIYQDLYRQAHGLPFNGAALSDDLAAIQGAIWTIEYPTQTVTAPNPTISALMAAYVAGANPNYSGSITALYAVNGQTQGFIIATPEPATWALMLVGFGGLGATLRRRAARATA